MRGKSLRGKMWSCLLLLLLALLLMAAGCGGDAGPDDEAADQGEGEVEESVTILLSTTTSTYDSGLLDYLIPVFTEQTGIEVEILSQGTGQALETGKRGDADVLLVHDRAAELELVEEGFFVDRHDVMYNDYVIVGPAEDPAGVKDVESVVEAFNLISAGGHTFVSRGDDSGTHRKELRLWEEAGVDPAGADWYLPAGQGMGATLTMAHENLAYTLTDRATYVSMKDELELEIVLEGDPALFNQYGIMAVNPEKHPHVKYEQALQFIEFLMSEEGQELISSFQVAGETLFFPGLGI